MKIAFTMLVVFLLSGCSLFIPNTTQQDGSEVAFLSDEWYDNCKRKSHYIVSRDNLSQLPTGFSVTVSSDDQKGCEVTYTAPEVVQGNVSITQQSTLFPEAAAALLIYRHAILSLQNAWRMR